MKDSITEYRSIQLSLLKDLIRVCDEHGLKYYAFFGTLLGIVRNEGYLTWDDDVDIAMPYEDYAELCRHADWFSSEDFLQTPLEPGLVRYAKLRRNGTTEFRESLVKELKNGGHHGISIDIIPLSEIPGSDSYCTPTLLGREKKEAVFLKSWLEPAGKGIFEGITVKIPAKPRKILTEVYDDWAWPHGVMDCRPVHWFFDTRKGYEQYVKRYTGMLEDIERKKIFLFGAADSLRIWLERFGLKDQVICTFDNDRHKWGKKFFDVEVRDPSLLPSLIDDNSRVIIVSLWHQEIGMQLEKSGIMDYYVYLDDYYDENVGNKVIRREDENYRGKDIPKWG